MPRSRSARAHEQVLDAALELFARRGFDAVSMDSIAEASGVSKATIYKHWPDKDALCLDVLSHGHGELPEFDSGDVRADLIALLSWQPMEREPLSRIMPHFQAYAAHNREFATAWKARVMGPPLARLRRLLQRGMDQGLLPADLDPQLATALLIGPMMYRHVLNLMKLRPPADMAERVVQAFWKAHCIR